MNIRPVRLAPCAAGASPTIASAGGRVAEAGHRARPVAPRRGSGAAGSPHTPRATRPAAGSAGRRGSRRPARRRCRLGPSSSASPSRHRPEPNHARRRCALCPGKGRGATVEPRRSASFRGAVGHDAHYDRPALRDRPLLLAAPLADDRAVGGSRRRLGRARAVLWSQDEQQPDPAGHRLDQGDGTAGRPPARTGLRQQPAGDRLAAREADRTALRAGDRSDGEAAGRDARCQLGHQPAQPPGRRLPLQGPHDRLHPGGARRRPRRTDRNRGAGSARCRRAGEGGRP